MGGSDLAHPAGLHRFISEDPLDRAAGRPNPYAYAANSLLLSRDPSGKNVPLLIAATAAETVEAVGAELVTLGASGRTASATQASLPDVPTLKESGVDLSMSLWRGIAVPRGTPEAVIARLERAFTQAAQSAEFRDFAARMGAVVDVRGARDFDAFMARDDHEIATLMEQIGLKKQ